MISVDGIHLKELDDLAQAIKERIQAHADANGISYTEAAEKAYLTLNGVRVKPIETSQCTCLGALCVNCQIQENVRG